jgi:hypothetical protein
MVQKKGKKQQIVEQHSLSRVQPMFSVYAAHLHMLICFRLEFPMIRTTI